MTDSQRSIQSMVEPIHIDCQSREYDESGINQYFDAKVSIRGVTQHYDLVELDFNVGKLNLYHSRTDSKPFESFQLFTVYDHSQDYSQC